MILKERTPGIMEYESKSSTHSHWGIRNTTKRHQEEGRRTGN